MYAFQIPLLTHHSSMLLGNILREREESIHILPDLTMR